MFVKALILTYVIALVECRYQSYFITGPHSWDNDIKKCASGGEDSRTKGFDLKTLDSVGLKYDDIKRSTTVVAHGRLQLYTKGTGLLKEPLMSLRTYREENYYKSFSHSWEESARIGWGSQISKIVLTIKIHRDGSIELINYVYAGSWGSISCAETKAYVEKIEIITNVSNN